MLVVFFALWTYFVAMLQLLRKIFLSPKKYLNSAMCFNVLFFVSIIACNDAVFERKLSSQWLTNQGTRPCLEMADNFKNKRYQLWQNKYIFHKNLVDSQANIKPSNVTTRTFSLETSVINWIPFSLAFLPQNALGEDRARSKSSRLFV